MDKSTLINNIIHNFIEAKNKNISVQHIDTIHNVIFINDLKKMDKLGKYYKDHNYLHKKIISKPEYYHRIKQILFETIECTNKELDTLKSDFRKLENAGFDSFCSYDNFNPNVKRLLQDELKYMETKKIKAKYIDCERNASTIFTNNHSTSLHKGILNMIEYMNMSQFMSYDVFMNMESKYTNINIYQTNANIKNIYLLANENETNYDINDLDLICQIGETVIDTMNQLFGTKIKNLNVDLILFLSNALKQFPKHNQPLTENEVNSADTYTFPKSPLIRMYRREEMIKVFIHELIHATQCDTMVNSNITQSFNVDIPLKPLETITETFAEFINCVLYSYIRQTKLEKVMKKEIDFGFQQSGKILNHFNFTSIDEFLKKSNKKIIQTTSAFEYHILKTILLFKFDDFLLYVNKNKNITELITRIMNTKEYQNKINLNIKVHEHDSFRMTIIDLNKSHQNGGYYNARYEYYKNKYLILKKTYSNLYI